MVRSNDFSGVAAKSSLYSFSSMLVMKLGGLLFTLIVASVLMPETFGIFSLASSIIALFLVFTDLGINRTFLRYLSSALGSRNIVKSRSYFRYFFKRKFLLSCGVVVLLVLFSPVASFVIYDEPLLFYPLLFSAFFLFFESMREFMGVVYVASRNMRPLPFFDFVHQSVRLLLSFVFVLFLDGNVRVTALFVAFGIAGLVQFFLLFFNRFSFHKGLIFGRVSFVETDRILAYLRYMGIASVSLVFFGSIDILMLGFFVGSDALGYYRIATSLVFPLVSAFSLSGVLLPLFVQLSGKRLERGFYKTFRYLILISVPAVIGLLFVARDIISLVLPDYIPSLIPLYPLSFLIILGPLNVLYTTLIESRERSKILAFGVFSSAVLNILLNLFLITYFLDKGPIMALFGAGLATVISRFFLFVILSFFVYRRFGISFFRSRFFSPVLASFVMLFFLFLFDFFVSFSLFYSLVFNILFGIVVYVAFLFLFGGVCSEDFRVFRSIISRSG